MTTAPYEYKCAIKCITEKSTCFSSFEIFQSARLFQALKFQNSKMATDKSIGAIRHDST